MGSLSSNYMVTQIVTGLVILKHGKALVATCSSSVERP